MNYNQQINRKFSLLDESLKHDVGEESKEPIDDMYDVTKLLFRLYSSENTFLKNVAVKKLDAINDSIDDEIRAIVKKVDTGNTSSQEMFKKVFGERDKGTKYVKGKEKTEATTQIPVIGNKKPRAAKKELKKQLVRQAAENTTRERLYKISANDDIAPEVLKQEKPERAEKPVREDGTNVVDGFSKVMDSATTSIVSSQKEIVGVLTDIKSMDADRKPLTTNDKAVSTKAVTPSERLLDITHNNTTPYKFGNETEKPDPQPIKKTPTRKMAVLPLSKTINENIIRLIDIEHKQLSQSIRGNRLSTHTVKSVNTLNRDMRLSSVVTNSTLADILDILKGIDDKEKKDEHQKRDQKKKFDQISESRKIKPKKNPKPKKDGNALTAILGGGKGGIEGILGRLVAQALKGTVTTLIPLIGEMAASAAGVAAIGIAAMITPGNIGESGKYHTLDEFGRNGKEMDDDAKKELQKINDHKAKQDQELMKDDNYRKQVDDMKSWSDYDRRQRSLGVPYQDQKLLRQHKEDIGGKDEVAVKDKLNSFIPKVTPSNTATTTSGTVLYKPETDDDPVLNEVLQHVIKKESAGGNNYDKDGNVLTSKKGARGAMQVMPATAQSPGYHIDPAKDDSVEEYNRVGRDYIKTMYKKYGGDVEKTMASYNMGPAALDRVVERYGEDWRSHIPKETRDYIDYDNAKGKSNLNIASATPKEKLSPLSNDNKTSPQAPESKIKGIGTNLGESQGHKFVNNMLTAGNSNNTSSTNKIVSPTIVNAPTNNVNNTTLSGRSISARNEDFSIRRVLDGITRREFI